MTPDVYKTWKKISNVKMSYSGSVVGYTTNCEECDPTLNLYISKNSTTKSFSRAKNAHISPSGNIVVFEQHAHRDSIRALKLRKVKKEEMPKDSLVIYHIDKDEIEIISNYENFQFPEKYEEWLFYKQKITLEPKDSTSSSKELNLIVIKDLQSSLEDTIQGVGQYFLSEFNPIMIYESVLNDTITSIKRYSPSSKEHSILLEGDYKIEKIAFSEVSDNFAFISNSSNSNKEDDSEIHLWYYSADGKLLSITKSDIPNLMDGWTITSNKLSLSKDGHRVYFWQSPPPLEQDTTLLPEDIVKLELWTYKDELLYTQKETQLEEDKKRSYPLFLDINNKGKIINLTNPNSSYIRIDRDNNQPYALEINSKPYQKYISWKGYTYNDVYLINLKTGEKSKICTKENGTPRLSPASKYVYWFNREEGVYKIYNIENGKTETLVTNDDIAILSETNDTPQFPWSYGIGGWTPNEEYIIFYDRYDIWKVDPNGVNPSVRLTNGRENKIAYRIVNLDAEERYVQLDNKKVLLDYFDYNSKTDGYCYYQNGQISHPITQGAYLLNRIQKAENSNQIIFTKESYKEFPDLILSDSSFQKLDKISNANLQSEEYLWGDIEIFKWSNEKGEDLEGLLVLPENFDPNKKYPLLVNFYERSSDGLHRHRAPYAHRSTINYSYYSSKGYIIFNPDVTYEEGYPGRSCYEDVISGINHLIAKGFINKDKIGVQGHSWGGYQVAHLLTKTDIFACAESGAPVVNMVSAYGGIRWRSGMSRMFQYERTQSRLGASLWEKPELYLENSPIFNMDKVTTPVLILHNDKDGAVPWYQGIEYFVALRRLNKPAWFLNYNDEPHWPVKWQNRLDFNIRMEQFFDHYLMDKPMPKWMEEGIDPIEKGINQKID